MVVGRKAQRLPSLALQRRYYGMQFSIDGKNIEFVEEFFHLGHVLSSNLDDESEIINKRNSLCGKINNVLCYFRNCDPLLKVKHLSHYCHDFDGCALWDSTVLSKIYVLLGAKACGTYGICRIALIRTCWRQSAFCCLLNTNFLSFGVVYCEKFVV